MLNHDNYFTLDNHYLTNSKIGDWLKCKNYFYRKHVLGTVDKLSSDALTTGSAVDELLTDLNNVTDGKYVVREYNGATKDGKIETEMFKAQGKTVLTKVKYDEIMGLAIAVSETTAYKSLADHKTQEIISYDTKIGDHFVGLAGIPDWYKIYDNGLCVITDLKSSRTTDPKKYYYHSQQYGYFRQQAFYQYILEQLHPEIETFISRHLVVEKNKDIYSVQAYVLDQEEIDFEKRELQFLISEIANEKDFKKDDADFAHAIKLTDPRSSDWDEEEEE